MQTPDNAVFQFPVLTEDGRTQFRTFKKDKLLEAIDDDFVINSTILGSDKEVDEDYKLDFTRAFRINQVIQKNEI